MAESSAVPSLPGLAVTAVEWLPSGAESGLVRVRGRWTEEHAREPDLPVLALRVGGAEHRFDSLPDARFSREPDSWRGTYLVPAELVATDPEALWLEWPSGARAGLPPLSRGVEPPPVPAAPERPEEPDEPGGQVIDRAVLAERRARRAEAAEQAQARVAAEALKAVEVLELRSAELERRLEEATAERDALADGGAARREALAAALASAAALRSRSREWQLRMRTTEVARAGDAVRLAVLEAERAWGPRRCAPRCSDRGKDLETARPRRVDALGARGARRRRPATPPSWRPPPTPPRRPAPSSRRTKAGYAEARAAGTAAARSSRPRWPTCRPQLETAREEAGRAGPERRALRRRAAARADRRAGGGAGRRRGRIQTGEAALAAAETRLRVETVARTALEDELDRERRRAERALRAALEAEREARRSAEQALAAARVEAERTGTTLQERIAELERRAAAAPELERVAREHATEREPAADAGRLVADLDAAADALRRRAAAEAAALRRRSPPPPRPPSRAPAHPPPRASPSRRRRTPSRRSSGVSRSTSRRASRACRASSPPARRPIPTAAAVDAAGLRDVGARRGRRAARARRRAGRRIGPAGRAGAAGPGTTGAAG